MIYFNWLLSSYCLNLDLKNNIYLVTLHKLWQNNTHLNGILGIMKQSKGDTKVYHAINIYLCVCVCIS